MSTPTAITDRQTAEDALRAAGNKLRAARRVRPQMDELVVAALRAGVLKKDVVELSDLSPETVRQIARKHGIEPAGGYLLQSQRYAAGEA